MAQKFKMTEDFKRAAKGIIIYVITTLVFFPVYHLIKGDFSWGDTWSYALIQIIVDDMRVDLKPVSEAHKGDFCSVAVPVENQPVDHVNDNPAKEADERIHPRRGDKVFKWVED